MNSVRIGITRTEGTYQSYPLWLARQSAAVECIPLERESSPTTALGACAGLLLPGGADVHPSCYGREDPDGLCIVDRERDELEFTIIDKALQREIPILGICRGLQIMNVALGGTLIFDLPRSGKSGHTKIDGRDVRHTITVNPHSHLAHLVDAPNGETNSAHHQAADTVAPSLRMTAHATDGVVEALEWMEPEGKPYLLLVQWHPERMEDRENPFARAVAADFIRAVQSNQFTSRLR